ncbi:DUF4150 domain-containing protein [Pseudomonas schmalbachii]|uniref:DUF4150 domain-containing protein n=1 Tax=Pseudomonas schmalbachii TaxID=2816993 RepID=A0ABS3TSW8_9PSED|nr:DUF4150 domain-containing protein [Pseudomonas schmalbachii]MBO3275760.1 DUF4150 domain-containing protein [Pseudomonas schmalbachii]
MAHDVTARQCENWRVISLLPDVCKTPMGSSLPPVPYPVVAEMQNAVAVVPSVRANGEALLVYQHSKIPQTQGDEPGQGKGVKSGTVGANCYPLEHSGSVRAGGKYILRHGDRFWMNGA